MTTTIVLAHEVPQLAITCGMPRSGKTTLARSLEREDGWVRVCPDDIRIALHGQPYVASAEPFIWATAETMARTLLVGARKVIVDATNTTPARRAVWTQLASAFGLRLAIYLLDTPLDVCLARNNGWVPAEVMERMHRQFQRPTDAEGDVYAPVPGVGFAKQMTTEEQFIQRLREAQEAQKVLPYHRMGK